MGSAYTRGAVPAFRLQKPKARGPLAALSRDRAVTAAFPSSNSHSWASLGTAAAVTSAGRAGTVLPATSLPVPRRGRAGRSPGRCGPGAVPGGEAKSGAESAGVGRGRGVGGEHRD